MEISTMISSSSSCCLQPFQARRIVEFRNRVGFLDASRKPPEFPRRRSVQRFNLVQSQICYGKFIPEEVIEKPVGLSLNRREIGVNSACSNCQAKGAILCGTCSGSGLYVDSILESQGIIVKVRCLGCGGSGNIMCMTCGGRGHIGHY